MEALELANREQDPRLRQSLLTSLVAGGGFAGIELVGAMNDYIRGLLAHYPKVSQQEISVHLIVIGSQAASAQLYGLRFSGLPAWLMWRAIYLLKLPSWKRRIQVLGDWIIGWLFPQDMFQALDGIVVQHHNRPANTY